MLVRVVYVDGSEASGPPEDWASWRADGVDQVIVEVDAGSTSISGMTLYWLRPLGEDWGRGGAALGPGYIGGISVPMPPEVIIHPDGTMMQRPTEWVPDMEIAQVKLGWWYPGTEGRVV